MASNHDPISASRIAEIACMNPNDQLECLSLYIFYVCIYSLYTCVNMYGYVLCIKFRIHKWTFYSCFFALNCLDDRYRSVHASLTCVLWSLGGLELAVSFICLVFFFCGTRDQTQGLVHPRQAHSQWTYVSNDHELLRAHLLHFYITRIPLIISLQK
jgi:hypothetical protein